MDRVVSMADVPVSLLMVDGTGTVAVEILLSQVPYIDYSPSFPTPLVNTPITPKGVGKIGSILVPISCFLGSETERETAMTEFPSVSKSGTRWMYAFGPENHVADSIAMSL
jgi:hypothetical protein